MGDDVDPDAGLTESARLHLAETADDLHRVLVLVPPFRRTADAFEPFQLLTKLHETEPATSVVTALLLLTDRRWSNGLSQLVRRIAESDLLAADDLDLLAGTFVAAGDAVFWEMPTAWFGRGTVEIALGAAPIGEHEARVVELGGAEPLDPGSGDAGPHETGAGDGEPDDVERPLVARREVCPPLRRWAAARLVRAEPGRWASLRARAGELDSRSAAAVMCGLLDEIDSLPEPAQAFLIREGVAGRHLSVRRLALELVHDREGARAAYDLAKDDLNARIRGWAASLLAPEREPSDPTSRDGVPPRPTGRNGGGPPRPRRGGQGSLF